jgi:hypothetical protein
LEAQKANALFQKVELFKEIWSNLDQVAQQFIENNLFKKLNNSKQLNRA